MKISTWFGHLDDESGPSRLPGGAEEIVGGTMVDAETSLGEGAAFQPDLRRLALAGGLFRDDAEYNAAMTKNFHIITSLLAYYSAGMRLFLAGCVPTAASQPF